MSLGPCVLDPAYHVCAGTAINDAELIEQFERLYTVKLTDPSGKGVAAFGEFVRDHIYGRLPGDVLADLRAKGLAAFPWLTS